MKRTFAALALLGFWIISSVGCSGVAESTDSEEATTGRPPIAVETTKAAVTDYTEGIDVVGSLSPKFQADIKSEYQGVVDEVYVTEWVRVKKGTPLARIDSREMQILLQKASAAVETAKANLRQAEASGNRAERDYDRLLKLKEAGIASQKDVDDGLTQKQAAAAQIAAAKAQLNVFEEDLNYTKTRLSKTVISSPMEGAVSYRGVNVGDLVGEMGSPKVMFRIINPGILELTAAVPSAEMGAVRIGQPLTFSTDAIPGKMFTGKVMFVNPVVNEADRSVKVIAEVENKDEQLKGGLFVRGRIITGERTNVLNVPRSALLSWDVVAKKADIFVVDGKTANQLEVATGSTMGDIVEITSGLKAGDMVVVRGGFNLKDGDRVKVTEANGG
ncbi:MAG: efflux RND transporter periplasmic adaptor subunit [Candidatus Lindowbacteria bacterium]|nr:efflux RND transporter periplasmic adaptor subunit [Candidatus Lindowbacteria bacterium]